MLGLRLRPPLGNIDEQDLSRFMVLDDSFVIRNISSEETREVTYIASLAPLRPTPFRRNDQPVKITYTAQAVCNMEELKDFYILKFGKSIKMDFEGYTHYGYMSDLVEQDEDATFTFTYTSRIAHIPEDPGVRYR